MRIALIGAVESSLTALETLAELGCPPAGLLTIPHERRQRHSDYVDLGPVAERHGVRCIREANVNSPAALEAIRSLDPDYVFVIGWSQICGPEILTLARNGAIGYHPSALPQNRGRAVIPWTILQRQPRTAGTLFWINEGVDSGDILVQLPFDLSENETARSLYDKHMQCLRQLLGDALPLLSSDHPPHRKQDESRATYCAKRTAEDGWIDWTRSADDVHTLIRAVGDPYPGAFSVIAGAKATIWEAELVGRAPYIGLPGQIQEIGRDGVLVQCGDGMHVRLLTVQIDDDPRKPACEAKFKLHDRFGIVPGAWFLQGRGAKA